MPTYIVNGKTYDIPDDKVAGFEKKYPDAVIRLYNEGKTYNLPLSKRDGFVKKNPNATTQAQQPATEFTTEQPKQETLHENDGLNRVLRKNEESMQQTIDNLEEHSKKSPLGFNTVDGGLQYNPKSGKLEQTYLTPSGNRHTNKGVADMETMRFRQTADVSVSGQLRRANQRLTELKAKQAERANEVFEETQKFNDEKLTGLGRLLIGGQMHTGMQQADEEKNALDVAIHETEELIARLERQQKRDNGKNVGYWRGIGSFKASDLDFGMGRLSRAMTEMNAGNLIDENATDGEREAYDDMMGAKYLNEQAEQEYPDSWWYNMGVMTKNMVPFMLDFAIFRGTNAIPSIMSKGATKAATKVVGEKAVKEIAEQGLRTYVKNNGVKGFGQYAANWTIKALGTMGDDLLIRAPLMTNTVQAGKTASDIIDRKLGDVVVNEDGSYDFSNDKTWGSAVWQGEANAIIENYSEMFGTHLGRAASLKNMSKFADWIGAKRLSGVLAKADAKALDGIMGKTHELFNKMGVSDYFGEVAEEYYGQMWRTMLNLDDAYQQNPDGTRTNLLLTGQFHGDVLGGMALSMGLMGVGKHTINATQYTSMKHSVNKADVRAAELLGKEVWEPLRTVLDHTTNDNFGDMAESVANDRELTDDQKSAVLTYMERSMMLRGFNLGTLAQQRGGEQDYDMQEFNESYLDGYGINSPQEMNDVKNMYDYQRQRVLDNLGEESLRFIDTFGPAILKNDNSEVWNDEQLEIVRDYLNSKQVYGGMMQGVRDDIDGRIEQSNTMVDARINRTTNMIQGATMKQDNRKVYIVSGNLVQYEDKSGIDISKSDGSIIVRDAETGTLEQVSPDAVFNIDEPLNPNDEKEIAAEAIRQQFAQEAADKIDGIVTFNPGDTYTITGDDAQIQVQVVANEQGIVDNGDGTVNVSDGANVFPLSKETIQQQADMANMARVVAQFEQQRTIENAERQQQKQEASRPLYVPEDKVTLREANGNIIHGKIAEVTDDGYVLDVDKPVNGNYVPFLTRDELDAMLLEHNGIAIEQPQSQGVEQTQGVSSQGVSTDAENATVVESGNIGAENIPQNGNNAPQNIISPAVDELKVPAMQRIPKDMQGNPLYEQTDSDTAWDAIIERAEGDEAMAQTVADGMVTNKEAALKKAEKIKLKGSTPEELITAEKERRAAIDAAKQELAIWQKIAGTANRRKMEADAERRRIAEEAEAIRKAEEERLRAEHEQAERIKREALNGVPDIIDDTPQDARARGYRRVNGNKIDRQENIETKQGKDISIKFSDNSIKDGHVAVIDASQLQPSHINGQRNPLHFIDEAQPKERNDEASILSAQKIAGNIRPEEITSSVTAYTGAPTVNTRGEVIQGNNRSAALRDMWENHKDQAETYKQYLKDHANEFGVSQEDIDAVQSPVLVNMLNVEDDEAITLGQYVAQDTESGGTERIKPKNVLQKMGDDMRSFANLLLKSNDEEISFASLVDRNGIEVLKWLNQKGYISPTQYKSAFDSKGKLTAEAKNDIREIMSQNIFIGSNSHLQEMFATLPAKAQKAILVTAFRDHNSPNSESMINEIQNSIRAYYYLSQDSAFAEAKNFKEARLAAEDWKKQYQIDDVTGESYLPAENFSNFALLLATMYKGEKQSTIQNTFNKLYDLIQGTQEANLFEDPDNTPRTLAEAIKETLNIDYDGQRRSNVLVGNSSASQRGQQGSSGNAETRERTEGGNGTADSSGSTESSSGQSDLQRGSSEGVQEIYVGLNDNVADAEAPVALESLDEKTVSNDKEDNFPNKSAIEMQVVDERNLLAVHNVDDGSLEKIFDMGSMPMPSIAVTNTETGHQGFGDISLVFDKDTINPTNRRNKVYSADAWTPTFPSIANKVSVKVVEKVRDFLKKYIIPGVNSMYFGEKYMDAVNAEDELNRNGLENYLSNKANNPFYKYVYLKERGEDIDIPMKNKEYGKDAEMVIEVLRKYGLTASEARNQSSDIYFRGAHEGLVQDLLKAKNEKVDKSGLDERLKKLLIKDELAFNKFDSMLYDAYMLEKDLNNGVSQEVDYSALNNMLNERLDSSDSAYQTWIKNLFDGIVEKKGIRNNKDMFTASGNRRSWEALHDDVTPENILKQMLIQAKQGGGIFGGNIFGAASREYSSLEDVRKDAKKRLKRLSDQEQDEWRNTILNWVSSITDSFLPNADFGRTMDAASNLSETVAKKKTARGIYNEMHPYYKGFTMEHANELIEVVKAIQEHPVHYLEAKPQRIVGLNEVKAAVVPSDISETLRNRLTELGIPFVEYERGNEADRKRALNEVSAANDLRFQTTDETLKNDSEAKQLATDAVLKALENSGIEVEQVSDEEATQILGLTGDAELQAVQHGLYMLERAEKFIRNGLKNNSRGKVFELNLPISVQRKIRNVMGRDFDSHNITINSIVHALRNHGVGGQKITANSIPLTEDDVTLAPYIMTAPDRVEKSSTDATGRESIRFYKDLSNGYVVVVEKEYKNSPDDMETITMWAEMSPAATNAQRNVAPDTHVQNAILSTDAAKIRKDAENAIRNDAKSSIEPQIISNSPIFYSNAEYAVREISQEKAAPQQWIAMLKKNGGLKAGEDAWLGLEQWLNEQKGTVSKHQILDFIGENRIQIEEVEYGNNSLNDIQNEFDKLVEDTGSMDAAYDEMIERYGDDFNMAVSFDDKGRLFLNDGYEDYGEIVGSGRGINSTRLDYTTEGLENKREIALTVPSIEPYNEYDDVHFGDAGGGRAVAWVRFGDAISYETIDDVQEVKEFHAPYNNANGGEVYKPVGSFRSGDYVVHSKGRNGDMIYVVYINGSQIPVAHDTLEEAKEAMNAYYKEHPRKIRKPHRVLVIDEIQSKRHQDGREKGYRVSKIEALWREKEILNDKKYHEDITEEEYNRDREISALLQELDPEGRHQSDGVPSAPFEKNWHELAMKRMLRYAAENGYDKVAWTTGVQQAERYSISSVVDEIKAEDNSIEEFSDGTPVAKTIVMETSDRDIRLAVDTSGGIRGGEFDGRSLSDVVGKDIAVKLMQPGTVSLKGDGLRVGGEGMKAFYDKMLPSFVNKYAKKWGTKVGEVTLPDVEESARVMHSVDVTDDMRRSVMQGQPMFLRTPNGTVYGWTDGRKIYLTEAGLNPETPVHEYTHLWAKAMMHKNRKGWESIKDLLRDTPVWNTVVGDKNYASIRSDEDAVASEVLSRISGKENAAKMEAEAQRMIDEANGVFEKANTVSLLERMKRALQKFWNWVGKELFGIDKFESIEEVTDRVLWDLVNGTELNAERGEIERQIIGERGAANLDRAEEATRSVDNLAVAREMEANEKNANNDLSNSRLRKLEDGETCNVERIFKENKNFDFTAGEKIESIDDVAYIFKSLEDESIENSFAVLVDQNDKPTVVHLGMGHYTATMFNASALNVAIKRINPKKVYFVHNHPSGELKASNKDQEALHALKRAYGNDVVADGIIINLRSGNYGVFSENNTSVDVRSEKTQAENEDIIKVYGFNKQVFDADFDPSSLEQLNDQEKVAAFISSHRLGKRNKIGVLVLNNQMRLVGNVFTPYTTITSENIKDVANDIVYYTASMGGTISIAFGTGVSEYQSRLVSLIDKSSGGTINHVDSIGISVEGEPMSEYYREGEKDASQQITDSENGAVPTRAEQKAMADHAQQMASKLNLPNIEVVTNTADLLSKKKRAKGWFSKSSGKITIVIPNHTSVADVEQTILHEAVAHYGLRKLFGKHFDTFLDNVYANADEAIRRKIAELAAKNGWDFRKATEEYLAGLAERTNFEEAEKQGWWQKIKSFFADMLQKLGFENFRGVTLTDNELRYILWRSYENLKEGKHSSVLAEAADIAKQYELGVGEYANTNSTDNDLYRDGDPEIHERALARDRYEKRVKSGMYQSQEAMFDSMAGLKEAMIAITRAEGKKMYIEDIPGFENPYLGENRLSSTSQDEIIAFEYTLINPMLEEVAKLAPNKAGREELIDYMMAKHGCLERNVKMAERDFAEYKKKYPHGQKTLDDFRARDYAGLTALTGYDDVAQAELEAEQMVADYEASHDTTALWKKVNAVSKAILSKSYECGMISKDTYEKISNMYQYYIPLRGFDETTSADAYAYLTHKNSAFNAPIKKAQGRTSKADDPFANLQSMAESVIMQGNRNKLVKQRFLNFALNHPSDLVSVSDLWVAYDAVTDEWKPVFPDNIDSTDSPEEVERKMQDFETKMEALAQQDPDLYKRGKDAEGIPYRILNEALKEHQVVVKRNGRDYVITINGNPRAAQALNGQSNPDNNATDTVGKIFEYVGEANRAISAAYTVFEPDFIAGNFMRDLLYGNTMVWIKESPKYAIKFNGNYLALNPVKIKSLLQKHRKGKLNMNNKTEAMFYHFMKNGGETGYITMSDLDSLKKKIAKKIKSLNATIPASEVIEHLGVWIGEVARAIELQSRFAAFMTSREVGRNIDRSIYDAKEISVNFNKKGSGDKYLGATGQTALGNTAAFVSGYGRATQIFWNAALQGTFNNFGKYAMRNKTKTLALLAIAFSLAMYITSLATSSSDDDDDNYYNLPETTRRQNICIKGPGKTWIKIPLPIEYRAIYGMGELCGSTLFHNEELTPHKMLVQMSQLLPIDFMGGQKEDEYDLVRPFVPSSLLPAYDVGRNVSWTGLPIYKDTPYNKNYPEWTKTYKNSNKYLVKMAEKLNEIPFLGHQGGNRVAKGYFDINPANIEYLLRGYAGGFWTFPDKLIKLTETAMGKRDFDWRNVPIANRFITTGNDQTEYRAVNNAYFNAIKEAENTEHLYTGYKRETKIGSLEYAEKLTDLMNSEIFKRYQLVNGYEKTINKLSNALKMIDDPTKRETVETAIMELKVNMLDELEKLDTRK